MNKLTIGLITAGMINCLIIGWVACSQTHEEHLWQIRLYMRQISDTEQFNRMRLDWYMDEIEKIYRNTCPKKEESKS